LLLLPADLLRMYEESLERAELERQRAEQERQRRETAESEIARLRVLLAQAEEARQNSPRQD
jgi:hypothetical protein